MSRPSNATTSGGSVRPPVHRNAPSPTASSSKATPRDTNVSVRSDPESDDLYSNPEKQPSHVDKGEAKAAEELKKYLDDAELSGKPLPARTRVDWSDSHAQSPWSKKTILALDGGGVKGLSSLFILKRLLHLIEEIELGLRPNFLGSKTRYDAHDFSSYSVWIDGKPQPAPGQSKIDEENEDIRASVDRCFSSRQSGKYKVCHYFDYIAGTSTGGLSAIMLGRLEMSVQEAIDQYDIMGCSIFGRPRFLHSSLKVANYLQPKYSSKKTEAVFKDVISNGIGEELEYIKQTDNIKDAVEQEPFKGDPRRCRTMVVSYGPADDALKVDREYLFRTYDHHHPSPLALQLYSKKHLNPGSAHVEPIWKIARATSAAHGYFSPITLGKRDFHDGGMVANNPAEVALGEVSQMHDRKPMMIVTLGTGLPRDKKGISGKRYKSYVKMTWRVLKAMRALITESEKTANRVESACNDGLYAGVDHYRWNVPDGMGDIILDEWIPAHTGSDTKRKILDFTMNYLSQKSVHLRLLQCARRLVRTRRKRASTERWELFARKFVYFCPDPHCGLGKVAKTFFSRDELREHGIHDHSLISDVDVKNIGTLHHTCVFGRCGIDRVYVFGQQEELKRHLLQEHEVSDPEFMSLQRMEAWLDRGRWSPRQAAERQNSELKRRLLQEGRSDTVPNAGSKTADNRYLGADLNAKPNSRDGSNSSKPTSVEVPASQTSPDRPADNSREADNQHVEQNGDVAGPALPPARRRQTAPASASDPVPMTRQAARRSFPIAFRSPFLIRVRDSPS